MWRELVQQRFLSVKFVSSEHQLADIFTKPLSAARHSLLRTKLTVRSPPFSLRGAKGKKTVWNFGVVLMRIECGERESEEMRLPLVFEDWSSLRDLGKHESLGKFGTCCWVASWADWSTWRLGFVASWGFEGDFLLKIPCSNQYESKRLRSTSSSSSSAAILRRCELEGSRYVMLIVDVLPIVDKKDGVDVLGHSYQKLRIYIRLQFPGPGI
ncbi:hypothetical protein Prudu_008968 [Prunus dulcis]|uniref:Uncharacterized protein n=1 Tax=Prunus dulcis TaxID=3755 RepID=A0A4Y1R5R0_PRUDU|nr:hypothetical protein Prudu_008968 [Prunus dulcis]